MNKQRRLAMSKGMEVIHGRMLATVDRVGSPLDDKGKVTIVVDKEQLEMVIEAFENEEPPVFNLRRKEQFTRDLKELKKAAFGEG